MILLEKINIIMIIIQYYICIEVKTTIEDISYQNQTGILNNSSNTLAHYIDHLEIINHFLKLNSMSIVKYIMDIR